MSYGVHAIVKTNKETLSVHLGPAWYIENQELRLAPGDQIEVKGDARVCELELRGTAIAVTPQSSLP